MLMPLPAVLKQGRAGLEQVLSPFSIGGYGIGVRVIIAPYPEWMNPLNTKSLTCSG